VTITELLTAIGNENVQAQNVEQDSTDFKVRMTDGLITFCTAHEGANI
jgi:hypothetical protein